MAPIIELTDVHKRYRVYRERYRSLKEIFIHRRLGEWEDRWALRGLDLKVEPGETVGLIGSNGAGKSTTLKLIGKILTPDRGEVAVRGRLSALIELGAGFQPDYTGRENVYLNGSILGLSKKEIDRRFDDIVEFAELRDYIDAPTRTYSSGMYMRLGFSVAINVDPEIMLIDEILAVGDEAFQRKCLSWMDSFKARGGTVVFISHGLGQVRQLCQRVAWIQNGGLKAEGDPDEVVDAYLEWVQNRIDEAEERRAAAGARVQPPVTFGPLTLRSGTRSPVAELATGDPLAVEIPFRVHHPLDRTFLRVAIDRTDGTRVLGTATELDSIIGRGGRSIALEIPRLNLLTGAYLVTATIHDSPSEHAAALATCDEPPRFRVRHEGSDQGICYLEHSWITTGIDHPARAGVG